SREPLDRPDTDHRHATRLRSRQAGDRSPHRRDQKQEKQKSGLQIENKTDLPRIHPQSGLIWLAIRSTNAIDLVNLLFQYRQFQRLLQRSKIIPGMKRLDLACPPEPLPLIPPDQFIAQR